MTLVCSCLGLVGITDMVMKIAGPSPDVVWVLLVYVLCQTITFTLTGRFSDLFGRRWFFIGANALAFVGYMINGRAHSINMVIAGVSSAPSYQSTGLLGLTGIECFGRVWIRCSADDARHFWRARSE